MREWNLKNPIIKQEIINRIQGRILYYIITKEDIKAELISSMLNLIDPGNKISNSLYYAFEKQDYPANREIIDTDLINMIINDRQRILEEYYIDIPEWEDQYIDKNPEKETIKKKISSFSAKNPDDLFKVGKLYLEESGISKAISYFKRALDLEEKVEYHYMIADTYLFRTLDRKRALEHYKRTVEIDENHYGAYLGLLKLYEYFEKEKKYERVLYILNKKFPDDMYIQYVMAEFINRNNNADALMILENMKHGIFGHNNDAQKILENMDYDEKKFKETYEKYTLQNGDYKKRFSEIKFNSLYLLSRIYLSKGKDEKAVETLEESFKVIHENPYIFKYTRKNFRRNDKKFLDFIKENVKKFSLETLRYIYFHIKDPLNIEETDYLINRMLELDPKNVETKIDYSMHIRLKGDVDDALDILNSIDTTDVSDYTKSNYIITKRSYTDIKKLKELIEKHRNIPPYLVYRKDEFDNLFRESLKDFIKAFKIDRLNVSALKLLLNRSAIVGNHKLVRKICTCDHLKNPVIRGQYYNFQYDDVVDIIDTLLDSYSYNNDWKTIITNMMNYFMNSLKIYEPLEPYMKDLIKDPHNDSHSFNVIQQYMEETGKHIEAIEYGIRSIFSKRQNREYKFKPFPMLYLNKSLRNLGSLDEAVDTLIRAFKKYNTTFSFIGLILERALDYLGDEQKLEETSKKVINLYFSDNSGEIMMSFLREHSEKKMFSHPVYLFKHVSYFNHIIKLDNPNRNYEEQKRLLKEEYEKTRFARLSLKNFNPKSERYYKNLEELMNDDRPPLRIIPMIIEPTEIIINGNKRYALFIQKRNAPTIGEVYSKKKGTLDEALRKIALYHTALTDNIENAPGLEKINYESYLKEFLTRFVYGREDDIGSSFGENSALENMLFSYQNFISNIIDNPFVIHNDLSWFNILTFIYNNQPFSYIIDHEKMAIGNPSKDDSKFLMYAPITKDEIMEYRDYKMNHMIDLLVGLGWDSSRTSEFAEKYRHNFNINMVHNALTEAGTYFRRNKLDNAAFFFSRFLEFSDEEFRNSVVYYLNNIKSIKVDEFIKRVL